MKWSDPTTCMSSSRSASDVPRPVGCIDHQPMAADLEDPQEVDLPRHPRVLLALHVANQLTKSW